MKLLIQELSPGFNSKYGRTAAHCSPEEELLEDPPVGESRPANPDVLLQPEVVDLVLDPVVLPVPRPLRLARLDAADVVRGALHERAHQCICLAPISMNPFQIKPTTSIHHMQVGAKEENW